MRPLARVIVFLGIFLHGFLSGKAQTGCTTLGQNPYSAFPVCGATSFKQLSVPICGNRSLKNLCTDGTPYTDKNPFWYKFTCYTAGTLGFTITPLAADEDYDWQLFDITGRDPMDVYVDASLYLSANWSGVYGPTGTSSTAKNAFECSSSSDPALGKPTFSTMPALIVGHEYLLMISHFSDSQSGYTLAFGGGTASIVNPDIPVLQTAYAVCDGDQIVVKLNKKVRCNSLAADGSDFAVSGPATVSIASASGNGCTTGFDMDSIVLKLNGVLSPGTYTVTSKTGTDGNTLVDNCDNNLATGLQINLKFTSAQPTPMDSISPFTCITDTLQLVFSKPMDCSSIAVDGSDFTITGPATVVIKSATGICTNGVSTVIRLILAKPIRTNGNFTIHLQNGTDGNSIIDECGKVTAAGSTLSFTTKNITTADFTYSVNPGCKSDTLYLTHNGYGGTTQWNWSLDSSALTTIQNPVLISKAFGAHSLGLSVTNGICRDTASARFIFPDYTVKAAFASLDTLCPEDTLHFTDLSSSSTSSWKWDFGNGSTSFLQMPGPQRFPVNYRSNQYIVSLVARNNLNCTDTAYKIIKVLVSCYIAVPSAFTPNGDGLNDYLYPLNAFKADNLVFRIYNRYGQVIFETRDYTRKWDGRINNSPQPSGTYVWTLSYTERDTKQPVFLKGTTVLIR